jgi:hypothetical protein
MTGRRVSITTTPAKPAATPTTAHRGFTLHGPIQPVTATFAGDGNLSIRQGGDHILIAASAVPAFKRAVADLSEIT